MNASTENDKDEIAEPSQQALRTGWTTGACATAAAKAALAALITGEFPDPVAITLPGGETPEFALAFETLGDGYAMAGVVKDAGDDPDVTHGATVIAAVRPLKPSSGIHFKAGNGVGTVTKAGLPIEPGQAAINPVPRSMLTAELTALCAEAGLPADLEVTISIPGGKELAEKTWNPRLGIVGGLSILGTTGIVRPFSCSAWIHSIHRGVDVARAEGLNHLLGSTGATSEKTAQEYLELPDGALIDMGDFAGGFLKYVRAHPVEKLTIAGGFAKISKLAQGALDLHSGRSQVDMDFFISLVSPDILNQNLKERIQNANTALEVLEMTRESGIELAPLIAEKARAFAQSTLRDAPVRAGILIVDRQGKILAHAP
ncbi:cobalt-precorrin-5B (C(1))-methyltransferase [Rhizobium sp. L1K21]|uniref:cobalt-precorrin-5B (C(1))-methyltransferase n=1 Tax=Rhizobium sp. L1K21 TaxID=2954933 RepID=UPI0020924DCB|nr:cobalt-precorrin-5B (C(1))-methyltransferase [Rhizobium sp. L1K21]MCO6185799.1 cobalt-precorrin-5B (C(1))-methyltransferase [Rhizobium sp. L1K21]